MSAVLTPVVEVPPVPPWGLGIARRVWASAWPKILAVGLVVAGWQVVVWTGWRPEYVLPGTASVLGTLADMIGNPKFWRAVAATLTRALVGFSLALVIGTLIGILVGRIRPLRQAVGALITGLQTMPSISWFPLAILLFGLNDRAILSVVVLGAAPGIANGVVSASTTSCRRSPGRPGSSAPDRSTSTGTSSCPRSCPPASPVSPRAGRSPGAA